MSNLTEKSVGTFFPDLYEGVAETDQIITTEDKLFDNVLIELNKFENNSFILTADSTGLLYYEKLLGIVSDPNSESLSYRRDRVLSRISTAPPFTYNFLIKHLTNIIGEGNFSLDMNPAQYLLTVRIKLPAREFFPESEKFLKSVCPANIVIDLSLLYNTYDDLSRFTYDQLSAFTYTQLREEVLP